MQHTVILGKNGKLGRALQRYWAERAPRGVRITWLGRGEKLDAHAQADCVIGLWGVTSGSVEELGQNAALAEAAIRIAEQHGANRALHLSSAAVYGAGGGATLSEDAPLAASLPYGRAKIEMEARIAETGAPVQNCALRLANVAGCDSLFRSIAGGGPITLDRFEDAEGPERSYIAIPDLASVLEALMRAGDVPPSLNVAAPGTTAMADVAEAAGRDVIWRDAPPDAVQRVALDTSALSRIVQLGDDAGDAARLVESWRRYGGWA